MRTTWMLVGLTLAFGGCGSDEADDEGGTAPPVIPPSPRSPAAA